jgi:hypothetical protein
LVLVLQQFDQLLFGNQTLLADVPDFTKGEHHLPEESALIGLNGPALLSVVDLLDENLREGLILLVVDVLVVGLLRRTDGIRVLFGRT